MPKINLESLPEPGNKYKLGLKVGSGVGGEVYEAMESQTGKKVAIKIIELKKESEDEIQREFQIHKQISANENFPEFYDIYLKKGRDNVQKIWLVMEFCDGGDATSLVRKLNGDDKKMNELHIAYLIRETIKAVIHLHENDISHRDIRGSNILLTADGRVKLTDYGISKRFEKDKKFKTCLGSPGWLAPEVILCQTDEEPVGYDKKADVWALGITAIELGDGQTPFEDMHPGRALFQIVKNPPPTLQKPHEWSQLYNDFIAECLVKTPENRPFAQELLAHPFFEPLDKEETLLQDIISILAKYQNTNLYKRPDVQVRKGYMKLEEQSGMERILLEDLAAMTRISEDSVLFELHERFKKKEAHTFIGDILLILNSNRISDAYGNQYHRKYRFKAKSQNAPHIYSIADSAYRDAFHHEKPQHILFAGETGAGKTANMMHAMDHLLFLGQGLKSSEIIPKALSVIHSMCNAATPHNKNSTRHVLQTQLGFTDTGKVSGAVFRVYLLEKERVTARAKKNANFHIFYYFHDTIASENKLDAFYLAETNYKFLETESRPHNVKSSKNVAEFHSFENNLTELGFEEEQVHAIRNTLAAVILLGEIEFINDEDNYGVLKSPDIVTNVARLLGVDHKKLSWALLNYCLVVNGEAIMRRNSKEEADEAKNALAAELYSRLVDWVVNTINEKISVCRVIYGDRHVISLLDLYGFECYKRNTLNQLFVNTINEQLQFHYNQKIFTWDKQVAEDEGISLPNLEFNDNKTVIDLIMSKPDGLLQKIDEATRNDDSSNVLDKFKTTKGAPVFSENPQEFFINHYTGKIHYDASEMPEKNRNFLPPEIIDTMRLSSQKVTKQLFSSLLSKSGNLSKQCGDRHRCETSVDRNRNKEKNVNTTPTGQYSQSRQMRTAVTTFRGACTDLFKNLTIKDYGYHFVRCIRTDLSDKPGAFDPEVVRQQLRALAVVNTVLAIQRGYSYNVSFEDFIRRYKFLAFDFDENVEETKDNCRLLMLRLKLEGWIMGKTKVFLKYFNKEYLSRLYETQIKKIVKVQSMMRAFMARRKLYAKIKRYQVDADENKRVTEEDTNKAMEAKAASIIQKRFREYASSKALLTESEKAFIRPWCKKWRTNSIFHVLLLYRAEKLQALVNFCIQVHLYNQDALNDIQRTKTEINVEDVNSEAKISNLPSLKPFIPKLPFSWENLNLRGDVNKCEPLPDYDLEQLQPEVLANIEIDDSTNGKFNLKHLEDKEIQTEENTAPETEQQKTMPDFTSIIQIKREENDQSLDEKKQRKENDQSLDEKNQRKENDQSVDEKNQQKENEEKNLLDIITEVVNKPSRTHNIISSIIRKETETKTNRRINDFPNKGHPPPVKPRTNSKPLISHQNFRISLTELEEKFRNKNYNENGDDPPFNFRSVLKKTNYLETSRKSSREDLPFQKEISNFSFAKRKKSPMSGKLQRTSESTVTEIAPGILIYGKITDL